VSYLKRVIKAIKIFLIVIFMFSVVNLVSASLQVTYAEGSAGISDFRTVDDTISFNVSSTSDITTINGAAASCQKISTLYYYCGIADSQNQAIVSYTFQNQLGESSSKPINVDNSIGVIIYSVINSNGNVTLTYDITDTGYNNNGPCTGIDHVDVWWQGSKTDEVYFDNANCRQTGTRALAVTESGTGEFYLDVFDKIGNEKNSAPQNITIDVTPPEVSNLEIWNNGVPLTTVAPNTNFQVDITFDVAEENLSSIVADLSGITNNGALKFPYKNTVVPLSACRINDTQYGRVYNCLIPSKTLTTYGSSILVNITAKDESGNSVTTQLDKSLQIDNVISEVQITTDYCDSDDVCYVKNGLNRLNFKLTKDNFQTRQIYFDVGGASGRVFNCTGTECTGFVNVNCNDPVLLRTLGAGQTTSQDDSGNKLPYYERVLKCDNSVPVITTIDWGSNSQIGEDLVVTGSTVSLTVNVDEPDSKIVASAYFDKIKNETIPGICSEINNTNMFNCTWSVAVLEEISDYVNIVINATDTVNNTVSKIERKLVFGFKGGNETPSLLRATYSRTLPTSLNRAVLQLAQFNSIPMYAYAYYSVAVKQGQDVHLLSQDLSIDNCVLRERNGITSDASIIFSEIKLADIYKGVGTDHRIDFTFSPSFSSFNMFTDGTKVLCNVSAYVSEGKSVFKKPQILMIEIPFTLRNSQFDSPGEEYVQKIQDLEESTTSDYSSLIANLNKYMVTAQNICTVKNTVDYAGMSGVAIQLAGMALGPILGQSLKTVGAPIVGAYQDINSLLYDPDVVQDPLINPQQSKELPAMGIIGQACTFMSCTLDWNNPLTLDQGLADNIAESAKVLPGNIGGELTEGLTNSDLKNSLVMSAQKLCLPGIVYNLNKYRQVDCEYLECLKVYSASGLDVSQCEVMKASKTCSIIVGEAFELPYVRVGKNLFSNMADTIRMSYGYGLVSILGFIKNSGVCEDKASDVAIISCNLPNALQEYISAQKKTRMSRQFYYQETRDFCQSAGCIGPKCYPSNSINLGGTSIPLPQFTPTRDQQIQMDIMKRFGPLASDTYLLVNAHGSADPVKRAANLNEWNTKVIDYNKQHGTTYPTLPDVDKLSNYNDPKSNALISAYINKYNSGTGAPLPSDIFTEQLKEDPTFKYKLAITDYSTNRKLIESNPLYIGKKTNWGITQVSENTPLNTQKNYASLQNILPGGNTYKVYPADTIIGDKNYYYFDGNMLYLKLDGQQPQKMIEYDSDGVPQKIYVEDLKDKPEFKDVYSKKATLETAFTKGETAIQNEDTKAKALLDAREAYRVYMLKQKATVILNILLDQLGMRKFLTAEYWSDKWGPGQYITQVADAVDPEIWKNNLCNPDNGPLIAGNDQPAGTVYSCYNQPGQGCKLVLTFGAEYTDYGNNTNLYTMTYLVGTVPRDVQFMVRLKGPSGTLDGFTANKMLKANSYDSKATAMLSKKKYDKICISVTGNFPDQGDSSKEFCRSIKEDVFRTGKPVYKESTTGGGSGGGGTDTRGFFE
jgi:hypothetical protein